MRPFKAHRTFNYLHIVAFIALFGSGTALHAQGIENAMEAMFRFILLALLVLGTCLCFALAYVFQRRPWQRIVVLVLAGLLCVATVLLPDMKGSGLEIIPIASLLMAILLGMLGGLLKPRRE